MIISHKNRFMMLGPWKTASQTTRARLRRYDESQYPTFFYFNTYLNRVVHQHITRAEFECLPEAKLGYLAATFVRNPYDRAYSGFRQLQKDIQEQPSASFPEPWIRDLVRQQLAENFAQLCRAGFQFDDWIALVRDEQVYEIGRNSNFPLHPAHYWFHIGDVRAVDFIGQVETFEADFRRFLSASDGGVTFSRIVASSATLKCRDNLASALSRFSCRPIRSNRPMSKSPKYVSEYSVRKSGSLAVWIRLRSFVKKYSCKGPPCRGICFQKKKIDMMLSTGCLSKVNKNVRASKAYLAG
jgi:hypothetical protein